MAIESVISQKTKRAVHARTPALPTTAFHPCRQAISANIPQPKRKERPKTSMNSCFKSLDSLPSRLQHCCAQKAEVTSDH